MGVKRKTGWTTLANHTMVSGKWNQSVLQERCLALCLDLPEPFMLGNQTHPCEAIKLDFSFHISENISQLFWREENNCPNCKGVKSQELQFSSRAGNRNNSAASPLQNTILHYEGFTVVQQIRNSQVWLITLLWEVSYRNETTGSLMELFPFADIFVGGKKGRAVSLQVLPVSLLPPDH